MSDSLIARTASMTVQISLNEVRYYIPGRLALFRIYRKAMIERMRTDLGNPVKVAKIEVGKSPLFRETIFYLTVRVTEVL